MLDFIFPQNAIKLEINIDLIIESKTYVASCHPTEQVNKHYLACYKVDILSLLLDETRDQRGSGIKKVKIIVL